MNIFGIAFFVKLPSLSNYLALFSISLGKNPHLYEILSIT